MALSNILIGVGAVAYTMGVYLKGYDDGEKNTKN